MYGWTISIVQKLKTNLPLLLTNHIYTIQNTAWLDKCIYLSSYTSTGIQSLTHWNLSNYYVSISWNVILICFYCTKLHILIHFYHTKCDKSIRFYHTKPTIHPFLPSKNSYSEHLFHQNVKNEPVEKKRKKTQTISSWRQ